MIDADAQQAREIWELVANEGYTPDEATRKVLGVRPSVPAVNVEVTEKPKKKNKYGAIKQEEDGYSFDSTKERTRYRQLKHLLHMRDIDDLEVHPSFTFEHNGVKIGRFTPDFAYTDPISGERIVEDVKGGNATKTEAYRLRKKMLKAFHGIDVREV